MKSHQKGKRDVQFTLSITGLAIPKERKAQLEESAQAMAGLADSLGYLDPLDQGLPVIFDPRV